MVPTYYVTCMIQFWKKTNHVLFQYLCLFCDYSSSQLTNIRYVPCGIGMVPVLYKYKPVPLS
jgi:hypothetical protein